MGVYKKQRKTNKINNFAKKTALSVSQKLYTHLNNIAAPTFAFARTPLFCLLQQTRGLRKCERKKGGGVKGAVIASSVTRWVTAERIYLL